MAASRGDRERTVVAAALRLGGEIRPDGLRITLGQDLAATGSLGRGRDLEEAGSGR